MAVDRVDDLAAELFAAARRERAADDVRARVLTAVVEAPAVTDPRGSGSVRRIAPFLGLAAVVAGLAVSALVVRSHVERGVLIGPETVRRDGDTTAAPRTEIAPKPEPPSTSPVPSDVPVRRKVTPQAPSAPGQGTHVASASLPEEIAALDRARTALSGGDASSALRAIDEYERVLHGTRLMTEATLLRIEALSRSNRAAEASTLAARFVRENPGSALADRARSFAETSQSDAGRKP
jgi:hypothetical protein